MTLADLHDTTSRLLADPRCSPTTPVEVHGNGPGIWKIEIADLPRRVIIYLLP